MPAPERFVPLSVEHQGIEAIDNYKMSHIDSGNACRTMECLNRNDGGEGWDGYCADCADRLESKKR